MRKVRWAVPGLAVVAVASAGVWSLRSTAPVAAAPAPEATESRAGAPADLERELRALRAELAALRREQARQPETVAGPSPLASQPPAPEEASRPATTAILPGSPESKALEEARQARGLELEAELEAAVNTEPRDSAWAGRTEALVTDAFRGPDFTGSRLARVECRTRLCVLEVEHEAKEARADLLGSLTRVPGLRGQAMLRPSEDGSKPASRIYLARPGERLPMTLRR